MSVVIPDQILQAADLTEEELRREIAVMLFRQERLSLGQASHLAGMHQFDFMQLLSNRDVCIHYDVEEFQQDLQTLREMGRLN
jgi:predicted HTH domain antitoxin